MPANRVAALATWLTGLGALVLGVTGTLPTTWQNTALIVGGLLTKGAVAVKFLDGSQKYDQREQWTNALATPTPKQQPVQLPYTTEQQPATTAPEDVGDFQELLSGPTEAEVSS